MYYPDSMVTPTLIIMLAVAAIVFWVRYFHYQHGRETKRASYQRQVRDNRPVGRLSQEQRRLLDKVLVVEIQQQGTSPELMNGVGRIDPDIYREQGEVLLRQRQAPAAPRMHGGGTVAAIPHIYHEINGVECWLPANAVRHIRGGAENTVEFVMAEKTAIVVRINETYDLFARSTLDEAVEDGPAYGDIVVSDSVNHLCLSPLPLPTLHEPSNARLYIKAVRQQVLMLSARLEHGASDWRFAIGLAMFAFAMLVCFPVALILLLSLLMGEGIVLAAEIFLWMLPWTVLLPLLLIGFLGYRLLSFRPGRGGGDGRPALYFHRHRREVAFVDPTSDAVVVQPWEATEAWLEVVRGRMHGFGGHRKSLCLCFGGSGMNARYRFYFGFYPWESIDTVISHWEAVRQFMEGAKLDGVEQLTPDEFIERIGSVREGSRTWLQSMETARKAHAGRPGAQVWWWLKRAFSAFALPYWISGLEYRYTTWRELAAARKRLGDWMQPLPDDAHAKPGAAYVEQMQLIASLAEQRDPLRLEDVFHEVCDKPTAADYRRVMTFDRRRTRGEEWELPDRA